MKASEFLAKQHAAKNVVPHCVQMTDVEKAFQAGFVKAREMAGGMLTDLGGPKNLQLAILIGAIGKAEVHPCSGIPVWVEEDKPSESSDNHVSWMKSQGYSSDGKKL